MSKPPKRKAENKSSSLGSGILRNCQELLMSILNLYINVTFIIIYICLTKVSCIPFSLLLELVRKLLARHSY